MDRNQRCVVALSLLFPGLAMAQKSVCDQSLDELIQHATRQQMEQCLAGRGMPVNANVTPIEFPLHDAALRGYVDVVRLLLKMKYAVDAPDAQGNTALHNAALKGRLEVVSALLDAGAAPNAFSRNGSTPLHEAALGGNSKVIELLVSKGASVDAVDAEGNTPLHLAAAFERKDAIDALWRAHANPRIANKRGQTPAIDLRP